MGMGAAVTANVLTLLADADEVVRAIGIAGSVVSRDLGEGAQQPRKTRRVDRVFRRMAWERVGHSDQVIGRNAVFDPVL